MRPFPRGAGEIARARKSGFRPAQPVIVTYVGDTEWDGVHVHCESGQRYDWAWSEELPLVIAMRPGVDAMDAIRGCFWPCNAHQFLTLIDVDRKLVSYVVGLLPKPKLWPEPDVTRYWPTYKTEVQTCN